MAKPKGLTKKQRIFVKELTRTLAPTDAAMIAFDCKDRKVARNIASALLAKLGISLTELMDKMGLDNEQDIADLKSHRHAQKVVGYLHNYKKNQKNKPEAVEPDETVSNEFLEVDDHPVQLKALELSMKLKGHLREKVEHSMDDGMKHLMETALNKLGEIKNVKT